MPTNISPPVIALNALYAGHYRGSKYTCTPGTWDTGVPTRQWKLGGVNVPGETGLTYTKSYSIDESLTLTCVETNGGVDAPSNGLTRPALTNLITDTTTRAEDTTRSRPGYGSANSIIDPLYGSRLTRVTGDPGTQILNLAAGQLWGDNTRARYESNSAWNCDESIIYLDTNGNGAPAGSVGGASSWMIFLDGQTYVPLTISRAQPSGWVEGRWSNFTPTNMIYVTDTEIRLLNVSDGSSISWHNFTGTYHGLSIGDFSGACSRDGDIWPLKVTRDSDSHEMAVIYRHSTDSVLGTLDFGTHAAPTTGHGLVDDLTISPSGTYVRIYYTDETAAVYTVACAFVRSVSDLQKPSHFSSTYDASGNEVAAGSDRSATAPSGGHIIMNRYSDGTITTINPNSFAYHSSGTNILGENADKWLQSDYWSDSGAPYQDEIVISAKDGSARGRIGNVMRGVNTGWSSDLAYANEIQSSVSPYGKRAIFHSSWRSTTGFPIAVFILDWRAKKFAGVEVSPNTRTVDITCTTTSVRVKRPNKLIPITATSSLAIAKAVAHKFSLTCTSAVTMLRNVGKLIAVTATSSIQSMTPVKTNPPSSNQTVNITATSSTAFARRTGKGIIITCTSSIAALKKAITRGINLTASMAFVLVSFPSIGSRLFNVTVSIISTTTGFITTGNRQKLIQIVATTNVGIARGLEATVDLIATSIVTTKKSMFILALGISTRVIRALENMRII